MPPSFFAGGLDDLATMGGGLDIAGQKYSLAHAREVEALVRRGYLEPKDRPDRSAIEAVANAAG
jgi:hypothetical protein